ncbi:MAG TPA: cupin domain-containing protein [Candidatus Dormibacteraeota bacterium]|nr:cupin domain-containing protein [Candidatus Dormibacteraeota bacterium]
MTTPVSATSSFLVEPEGGRVVMEGPLGVITKIPGTVTNRVMSIVEHPVAPRLLVPPHVHQDHDEWSYILEGRIGARVGDDEFIAEAGSYILKPRKIPHVFWNPDDRPARILEIITPSGLEEMFEQFGQLGARGELTPETMGETAARYGSTMFMDWVPELVARYGLTLMG